MTSLNLMCALSDLPEKDATSEKLGPSRCSVGAIWGSRGDCTVHVRVNGTSNGTEVVCIVLLEGRCSCRGEVRATALKHAAERRLGLADSRTCPNLSNRERPES